MSSSTRSISVLPLFMIFRFLCFSPTSAANSNPSLNYTNLVYNHCYNQTPPIPYSSLFEQLLAHSSQSKFFETVVTDEKTAISGLFQCRGDLSLGDCNNCVKKVGKLLNTLCENSVPARIQLSGCYVHYEVDHVAINSKFELLHKKCGEWLEEYGGFSEKRSVGFEEIVSCVGSSKDGFCEKKIDDMKFMAQCGEKLRECECEECVNNAVEIAEEECKDSVSAEIYVEGCFVSYSYDYKSHEDHKHHYEDNRNGGGSSTKLVAIVIGGIVALALVIALFHSIKNCGKKPDW